MKLNKYFIVIFFLTFIYTQCISDQNTVGVLINKKDAFNGYTLFTVHQETYLISNKGEIVHQWTSKYSAGKSVYLLENGNLLRAAQIPSRGKFIMPSAGGRVELFDWDGDLIWEYTYSTPTATQHHDIYPMPNGNVLILAITIMSKAEATQVGRKLITPPFMQLYNEQIIEIVPKNKNEVDIGWEWNIKDHLVQDHDNTKENYGIISENPQRLDINYLGNSSGGANWLHINSIQYNAELDQIVLSSKHLSEIYIIDHSTTTAEAATSSGGTYQKGGDFLYRWGNPIAYGQGTIDDQKLFGPHDPHWIEEGLPDAGNIILFNNGANRIPNYSEVYILNPLTSAPGEYTYNANAAYGPASPEYIYTAKEKTDFYSAFQSSAQRLANGNTFICEGANGRFFEIDSNEKIVWEYINPVGASEMLNHGDGTNRKGNIVFRAKKYAIEYEAFEGRDLTPGLTIENQGH